MILFGQWNQSSPFDKILVWVFPQTAAETITISFAASWLLSKPWSNDPTMPIIEQECILYFI